MNDAHVYEVRPRKAKRGMDLISDVLPFGRLWLKNRARIADHWWTLNDPSRLHRRFLHALRRTAHCG
jgi:hypothetical protein